MQEQPPASLPDTTLRRTSGLSIVSLVCGIASLLIIFPSLVAIITGHIAQSKIKKSNGTITGRGMALTGIICAYASILIVTSTVTFLILDYKESKRIKVAEIAEEIKDGQELHRLVIQYEKDHGQFPERLSELVTKGYVASLDELQPTNGGNWIYFQGLTSKSSSYKYFIRSQHHKVCIYVDGTDGSRNLSYTLEPIDFPVEDHEAVYE